VYMGTRSEEKAKAAIEQLRAEVGDKAGESPSKFSRICGDSPVSLDLDNVVWLDIDLTYPRKAKEAAEFILAHEQRLDILST
jgi:hypothetical protein